VVPAVFKYLMGLFLLTTSCTVDFLIQTARTTIHSVIAKKNRRTLTLNVVQVLGQVRFGYSVCPWGGSCGALPFRTQQRRWLYAGYHVQSSWWNM